MWLFGTSTHYQSGSIFVCQNFFARITTPFCCVNVHKVQEALNDDLSNLSQWIHIYNNGLKLNVNKTKCMSMARRCRINEGSNLDISIDGQILDTCQVVRFLGVDVDRQLCWEHHIVEVRRKCLPILAMYLE